MFSQLNLDNNLRIVRFGGDFKPLPEAFLDLEILVKENEDLYPGIDKWYEQKVLTGLKKQERRAYVIYKKEKPVGAAIIRLGDDTKICSVRLAKEEQGKGIGQLIFTIMAIEMRHHAKNVHFTTPESLWLNKNKFFTDLGFQFYDISNIQYRLWEQELVCGGSFDVFWRNVIRDLPKTIENISINGNDSRCDIVISVKPEFANRMFTGQKRVEIRRKFSHKWQKSKALIYASSPQRHFVGEALIGDVFLAEPVKIWENFRSEIDCGWDDYSAYCHGAEKVYAITFAEVKKFKHSISERQVEHLIQRELNPPQSYCRVKDDTVWPTALALSCLLRAHLW